MGGCRAGKRVDGCVYIKRRCKNDFPRGQLAEPFVYLKLLHGTELARGKSLNDPVTCCRFSFLSP